MNKYDELSRKLRKQQADPFSKASTIKRANSLPTYTTPKKTYTYSTPNRSASSSPKTHKSVSSMTTEAQKRREKELEKSTVMQFTGGVAHGLMPVAPQIDEDKKTTAVQVGNVVGTIGSYMTGYGLAKSGLKVGSKTATKLLGKEIGSKGVISTGAVAAKWLERSAGKSFVSKIAKSKTVQKLAFNELNRTTSIVTKKAIQELAERKAKAIALSAATNFIADASIGTALDAAQVKKQGVDLLSKEGGKQMAINAGINIVAGGVMEGASPLIKSLSSNRATKETAKVLNALLDTKELKNKSSVKALINNGQLERARVILEKAPDKIIKNVDDVKIIKKATNVMDDVAEKALPAKALKSEPKAGKNVDGIIAPKDAKNLTTSQIDTLSDVVDGKVTVKNVAKQGDVNIGANNFSNKADILKSEQAPFAVKSMNEQLTSEMKNLDDPLNISTRKNPLKTRTELQVEPQMDKDIFKTADNVYKTTPLDRLSEKTIAQRKRLFDLVETDESISKSVKGLYDRIATEEGADALLKDVFSGKYKKSVIPNKITYKEAYEAIKSNDLEFTYNYLSGLANRGLSGSVPTAQAEILAKYFDKQGNRELFDAFGSLYVSLTSENGLALQMSSHLSDSGRYMLLDRMLAQKSVKSASLTKTKKAIDFLEIPEIKELYHQHEALLNSAEIPNKNKLLNESFLKIMSLVDANTPPSLWAKIDNFRMTCMLMNFKTHANNLGGNVILGIAGDMTNVTETAIQKVLVKSKILKASDATASVYKHKKFAKMALDSWDGGSKNELLGGSYKFMPSEGSMGSLANNASKLEKIKSYDRVLSFNQESQIMPVKKLTTMLDWIATKNFQALNVEDEFFMKNAYLKNYERFLTAKGAQKLDKVPVGLLQDADDYAKLMSLEYTYRGANDFARRIREFGNRQWSKKTAGGYLAGGATKLAVPFVKVPLNIAREIINYNPLHVLKGSTNLVLAGKSGSTEAVLAAAREMSKGFTGTMIAGLGAYLYTNKLMSLERDESPKQANYDDATGFQPYSLVIGGNSYSIDWASPLNIQLFMGGVISKTIEEYSEKEGFDPMEVASLVSDSLIEIMDPLIDMTVLRSFTDAVDTQYTEDNVFTHFVKHLVGNAINQFIPTALGQLNRGLADSKLSTVSTHEDLFARGVERQTNLLKVKLGTGDMPIKYDVWGRPVEEAVTQKEKFNKLFQNLFNPTNVKPENTTYVDDKLAELQKSLSKDDKASVLPSKSSNYEFTYRGEKFRMTADEYSEYSRVRGSDSYSGLRELFDTREYKDATTGGKQKLVRKVYDSAADNAKDAVLKNRGYTTEDLVYNDIGTVSKTRFMDTSYAKKMGDQKAKEIYMEMYDSDVRSPSGTFLAKPLKKALDNSDLSNTEKGEIFDALSTATNPYGNFFKPIESIDDTTSITAKRFKETSVYENKGGEVYILIYNSPIRRESGYFDINMLTASLRDAKTFTQAEKREIFAVFSTKPNPF